MRKRKIIRLGSALAVAVLAGGATALTHDASAAPVVRSTRQPAPGLFPQVSADFEVRDAVVEYFPDGPGAEYTLTYVHNGGLSVGRDFPLAPTYQVTVTAPPGIVISCYGEPGGAPRGRTCTAPHSTNWASGQTRTFQGAIFAPDPDIPLAGTTLSFSVSSALPDPNGATGTVVVPAR